MKDSNGVFWKWTFLKIFGLREKFWQKNKNFFRNLKISKKFCWNFRQFWKGISTFEKIFQLRKLENFKKILLKFLKFWKGISTFEKNFQLRKLENFSKFWFWGMILVNFGHFLLWKFSMVPDVGFHFCIAHLVDLDVLYKMR